MRLIAARNDEEEPVKACVTVRVTITVAHIQNNLFCVPWLHFLWERHNRNMPDTLIWCFFSPNQTQLESLSILTRKILQNFQSSTLFKPPNVDFSILLSVLLGTLEFV